jgi:hypothetical protein
VPFSFPASLSHDSKGNIKDESLKEVVHFIFGNTQSNQSSSDDSVKWGWLSPARKGLSLSFGLPNSAVSYRGKVLSATSIQDSFSGLEVRHRDGQYIINHGTVDYFWTRDYCSQTAPDKQTLGLLELMDNVRCNNNDRQETYTSFVDPYPNGPEIVNPSAPPVIAHIYPSSFRVGSLAGMKLKDKDNKIQVEYFTESKLFSDAKDLKDFQGESHSFGAAQLMKQTGFSILQSRSLIDKASRKRLAKEQNPDAKEDELLAKALAFSDNDPKLQQYREDYKNVLVNFESKICPLSGNISNDIKSLKSQLEKLEAGSVAQEVCSQFIQDHENIQKQLQSVLETTLKRYDTNPTLQQSTRKNLTPFITPENLTQSSLFKLLSTYSTQDFLLKATSNGEVTTSWLFLTRYSGLDKGTLEKVLHPNEKETAETLACSLRFLGNNREQLFSQGLFNPDSLNHENRFLASQLMVDLPGIVTRLLEPNAASLPEHSAYLATAFRAQFIKPETEPMKRSIALQRFATAIDKGNNLITLDDISSACQGLSKETYDPTLSQKGITKADYDEIRGLLTREKEAKPTDEQLRDFTNGIKNLFNEHGGKQKTFRKDEFLMALAAIDVQKSDNTVSFYTLDGYSQKGYEQHVKKERSESAFAATLEVASRVERYQNTIDLLKGRLTLNTPNQRLQRVDTEPFALPNPNFISVMTPYNSNRPFRHSFATHSLLDTIALESRAYSARPGLLSLALLQQRIF